MKVHAALRNKICLKIINFSRKTMKYILNETQENHHKKNGLRQGGG